MRSGSAGRTVAPHRAAGAGRSEGSDVRSIDEVSEELAGVGYLPSREIATAVFLADRMEKPILVEGPAGSGKTELARAFAAVSGRSSIRLQCYEGLDESRALYEWEYAKQLLYTQLLRDRIGETVAQAGTLAEAADRIAGEGNVFFSERFLLPRPILQAIRREEPALLLVDEIDKADPELEAFLLEVLSDWAVIGPGARHHPAPGDPAGGAHLQRLARALGRAQAPLPAPVPRPARPASASWPSSGRGCPRRASGWPGQLVAAVAQLRAAWTSRSCPPSPRRSTGPGPWPSWVPTRSTPALLDATLSLVLKYEADLARARSRRVELLSAARAGALRWRGRAASPSAPGEGGSVGQRVTALARAVPHAGGRLERGRRRR